jgi:hypothetical protein
VKQPTTQNADAGQGCKGTPDTPSTPFKESGTSNAVNKKDVFSQPGTRNFLAWVKCRHPPMPNPDAVQGLGQYRINIRHRTDGRLGQRQRFNPSGSDWGIQHPPIPGYTIFVLRQIRIKTKTQRSSDKHEILTRLCHHHENCEPGQTKFQQPNGHLLTLFGIAF